MKLATLRAGGRDGTLVVVNRDGSRYAPAGAVAPTLQAALDDWTRAEPGLRALAGALERGQAPSQPLDVRALHAPLPRAYEWVDGSAFLNHVILVRKARGAGAARDAAQRSARLPGRLERPARAHRRHPARRPGVGARLRVGGLRRARRHAAGDARRRRRRARQAADAGERRHAAQPRAGGAGQELRLLPVQAGHRVLAVRRHPRRARRRLARRAGAPAPAHQLQRRAGRRLRRGAGDALLVLRSRAAPVQDARFLRRHHRRQRHGLERRSGARHLLPGRAAHDRDHRKWASPRRRS